eukprot:TRINITY_DN28715_c0_g1_i1.p1 TRINITY_DN28715_c0_g1~~TRINITY_DN28715_c0_g1_i1.p1  ORF type:complete len:211 (-),score=47.28 TRINITY_DN28715_c0_g1_i1:138-770(-)
MCIRDSKLYVDDKPTTCCGKCCNKTKTMRPDSTSTLAILPFFPRRCCSVGPGMNDDDLDTPPASLEAAGLTRADWIRYMDKLQEVQAKTSSLCCLATACIFSFGGSGCCCRVQASYQNALREWQDEFNNEVLSKINMFCKTQTHVYGYLASNGRGMHRNEIRSSWLAVAVGAEAIQALQVSTGSADCDGHFFESGIRGRNCCGCEDGFVV